MLVVGKDSANVELSAKEIKLLIVSLNDRIDFLSSNIQKINQLDFITYCETRAKLEALLVIIHSEESEEK